MTVKLKELRERIIDLEAELAECRKRNDESYYGREVTELAQLKATLRELSKSPAVRNAMLVLKLGGELW